MDPVINDDITAGGIIDMMKNIPAAPVEVPPEAVSTTPTASATCASGRARCWTTVCTPGSGLKTPIGIAVDASGNLFAADTAHNAVKEISWLGGNFGTTAVGTTSPFTISMYFFIDQATTFGSILIQTQGTSKNDFTDAGTGNCWTSTPYASGSECTVAVNFTPTQTGSRSGTVSLLDPSGNLLATAVLQGIGQ